MTRSTAISQVSQVAQTRADRDALLIRRWLRGRAGSLAQRDAVSGNWHQIWHQNADPLTRSRRGVERYRRSRASHAQPPPGETRAVSLRRNVRGSTSDRAAYDRGIRRQIGAVFRSNPDLPDHRKDHPWLTCFLGDPFAHCWFVAENPSLGQVERALVHELPEPMWGVSKGDVLFREMLVKHKYKSGTVRSKGGWRCYITDVIKSVARAEEWKRERSASALRIAEVWAPVLAWEMEQGRPHMIVTVGMEAAKLLDHLASRRLIPTLPRVMSVDHYSYIAVRADAARRLGPMHPIRLAEYDAQFAAVARASPPVRG